MESSSWKVSHARSKRPLSRSLSDSSSEKVATLFWICPKVDMPERTVCTCGSDLTHLSAHDAGVQSG